ncbi:conserved hypothetical protein [Ferroglobus placidus DSM 10642]|uniref:Metallo-beta-lactamase domain-containing protein n=1 Tax=Ferroglobus placidus (strain DSM 10642 / AEDII12DO) TaxID=589924 RepID=D3S3E6_FERPA|nr:MBL fold metallo-hydrolase [Ferroglobus placidus]ADC64779.1 conserved hypothetical protein [Ferroglobus placidus DSM 10642]
MILDFGSVKLIDLPQKMRGFRNFISSWVLQEGNKALLVDVGPASTIPLLEESLKKLGVEKVEYVLITHIHIDHAGGLGDFLAIHPEAKVVVSEKGKKHLINPEALWKGSLKVLGKIAENYGEIKPVKESFFTNKVDFAGYDVEIVETPGHAPHHVSFVVDDFLFLGEACGVHQPLEEDYYMRPATPPKFFLDVYLESIEKLKGFGRKKAMFGHFGMRENSEEVLKEAENQIKLWTEVVEEMFGKEKEEIKEELLKRDERFSRYQKLDDDVKEREDIFISNAIEGISGYIAEKRGEKS